MARIVSFSIPKSLLRLRRSMNLDLKRGVVAVTSVVLVFGLLRGFLSQQVEIVTECCRFHSPSSVKGRRTDLGTDARGRVAFGLSGRRLQFSQSRKSGLDR